MHQFEGIARPWLASVAAQELDLTLQVAETNSSDVLAHELSNEAENQDIKVFSIEYQPRQIADPFELYHIVIKWFGQTYGEDYIDDLISTHCYPLHREIIRNWYQQKFSYRHEPLLFDEAGYEEFEFFSGFERLLNCFAEKKSFVVLISNLHLAPEHILAALNRLLDAKQLRLKWAVMGFVPHSRKVRRISTNIAWQDCLRRLERQGLILPITTDSKSEEPYPWNIPTSVTSFDNQFRMIVAAVDMFAYRDAIRMADQVRRKYNDEHNGQLLLISSVAELMCGDLDKAIRDLIKAQNRLQSTQARSMLISSYFWLVICYTVKSQEHYARGAQEQCEKLALEYYDSRWYALSQFADFYINIHIAQHRQTQVGLMSLRFLLTELNYTNILAILQTQVYSDTERHEKISPRTYLKNCVLALRTARTNRNNLGVSVALHAMGVVYMRIGNVKQTQRLFELSLGIRERYQRKADLVPMLNGMGYFLVSQEEWQKAWTCFDRALSLLIENRNFSEVSVTLYNFIWLYTQSGNIQSALDTMNDLLELMSIRGVKSVPFKNLKDLYVLKGWLHLFLQQPIQARYCLLRVQNLADMHESSLSKILKFILSGRVALFENERPVAIRNALEASNLITEISDLDLYLSTTLQLEIARLYMDLGRADDAQPIFIQLRKKAHELGLDALAQRVSRASLGIAPPPETMLPNIRQPYRVLLDMAQKETQMAAVQHELSDLYQANLLVEMSAEEPVLEAFLRQLIAVLDRRVPANDFAVIVTQKELSDYQQNIVVSNEMIEKTLIQWQERLKTQTQAVTHFKLGGNQVAAWPLQMGISDQGWLVISGDEQQSIVWNEAFLKMVAQQLGLILDRRLREAYLEYRNKTDLLTGTLNRAGLFERLKKQFSQMKRSPEQPFVFCYFDLDHFKYFNDQFGHEVGDKVLIKLVQLVEEQLRGSDELGRIGGDEFIILSRDTRADDALALFERLRQQIASPQWWLPLLPENIRADSSNPVPQEEWISASFGAVVVDRWSAGGLTRIELLAQGDAAMYEAKKMGRNCVVVVSFKESDPNGSTVP